MVSIARDSGNGRGGRTARMQHGGTGTSRLEEEEAIRLPFTPHFHAVMMAHSHTHQSCCPVLFERAAPTWWDPKFDSDILENQYQSSSQATVTLRFQYALVYVVVSCIIWAIYWSATATPHWPLCVTTCFLLALIMAFLLTYTRTQHYKTHTMGASLIASVTLVTASLLQFLLQSQGKELQTDLTTVGMFAICVEILLLIYTVLPMPLYLTVLITSTYSVVFEGLNVLCTSESKASLITVRILLHFSIHLIGAHIMIMTQVRMRGTFMSVGQSLLVRRQLEIERALKEKMILSVMPPKVADWLLKETHTEDIDESMYQGEEGAILRKVSSPRSSNTGDLGSIIRQFRPFNMNGMDNVSILFADIVGFTRMSSNKTAEQLVGLLNDLFGRFDNLCELNGCEKISTLGDCYYCVSGCPEPKPDHAQCCVNMGLSMITAIAEFDADTHEDVNMRVGVHTGKVLCGIVGTKRFKFDVWSNDVTLANKMESSGKPGEVHVSQPTYSFLPKDMYITTEGSVVQNLKTYFIIGKKKEVFEGNKAVSRGVGGVGGGGGGGGGGSGGGGTQAGSYGSLSKRRQRPHSKDSKKASSLPNILDCGKNQSDEKKSNSKQGSPETNKSQKTLAPSIQLPRLTLPKLHRNNDKAKAKTTSLPKINSKNETNIVKTNDWSEAPDVYEDFKIPSTPSMNTQSPSPLPPSTPHTPMALLTPAPQTPVSLVGTGGDQEQGTGHATTNLHNSWASLTGKDPRKDSGIRSRRSSIQAQIFAMNGMSPSDLLTHRVSGYFTSSQSSVVDNRLVEVPDNSCREPSTERPLTESLTRFHQLRKQSDLQLIKCVQQDTSHRQYILAPALSSVTLFFVDPEMEKQYRQQVHKPRPYAPQTLASHHFNTYFDILVSALVFTGVTVSLFLLYPTTLGWLLLCLASTCWHLLLLALCLTQLMRGNGGTNNSWASNLYSWLTQWRPWHACGASLICLPLVAVFVNFSCETTTEDTPNVRFFYYLALVALIHLCNFTQLNCWMKNTLVSVGAVILLSLIAPPVCPCPVAVLGTLSDNTTTYNASSLASISAEATNHWFHTEVILDTILLLFLVWLLNREFEISYRLSFHSSMVAMNDKRRVQTMKDQADWLLNNIIPRHVVEQIKCTAKYSENHKDVGVMFASIDNFNELYDESYCGGKEYLRVLNELVGDFDELLQSSEFKNIEKIKTIGSTYMAASGLNPEVRHSNANPFEHIYELVEFAMAMQRVTLSFNEDLIEFDLILRIGINFGDVTAGVIGTTKLYYDIWGDAVNIASRMDTTGVPGYIQVSQVCVPVLQERYELEPRGQVYVKGKDNMNVFLLKGHRASS